MQYTIKEAGSAWGDNGDMYSVTFEEEYGEPTIVKSPQQPKPGDKISGQRKRTAKGKMMLYPPFKLDEKQKAIYLGQSLNLAVEHCTDSSDPTTVKAWTEMYYDVIIELAEEKLNG